MEREAAERAQLSEEDLDMVAGGLPQLGTDDKDHDSRCFTVYCCFAALMHNSDADDNCTCWSDYKCILVNNDAIDLSDPYEKPGR